jgi:hypothetical protein
MAAAAEATPMMTGRKTSRVVGTPRTPTFSMADSAPSTARTPLSPAAAAAPPAPAPVLPSPRGPTRSAAGHWDNLAPAEALEAAEVIADLRGAAAQGHAGAQFTLGYLHEQGSAGLPQDGEEAARMYRQAADQGMAQAQYNAGLLVAVDRAERAAMVRRAAEQGLAAAQFT